MYLLCFMSLIIREWKKFKMKCLLIILLLTDHFYQLLVVLLCNRSEFEKLTLPSYELHLLLPLCISQLKNEALKLQWGWWSPKVLQRSTKAKEQEIITIYLGLLSSHIMLINCCLPLYFECITLTVTESLFQRIKDTKYEISDAIAPISTFPVSRILL